MTTPEIPAAVVEQIGLRYPGYHIAAIRGIVETALTATDEHGERWYYHRDEVARLAEQITELRATVDGLRAENDRWAVRCRALLAEHEREVCPTCGSTDPDERVLHGDFTRRSGERAETWTCDNSWHEREG